MTRTKDFIKKQKTRLDEERTKVINQIQSLKRDDPFADPDHASDNAAIDTDVREQIGHETVEAELKDLNRRLERIESATVKAEKGDYGLCERCGVEIAQARLEFLPEARYCIDCEKKLVK